MDDAREPIVLATEDVALVSSLSARMTLSGEELISTPDFRSADIKPGLRDRATLIVDADLLPSSFTDWEEVLRDSGWGGQIIVVVDRLQPVHRGMKNLIVTERGAGGSALLAILATRRAQR